MQRTLLLFVTLLCALMLVAGCGGGKKTADKSEAANDEEATTTASEAETESAEPDFITVQHILIGFAGSVPGKGITRTQEEAQQLAEEVLKRAQAGEDFDALVQEFTDDSAPGIYKMANFNATADMSQRVFARNRMVPAFGDVGFPLAVGEIGMAAYDPQKSPYGWHIIKRVE